MRKETVDIVEELVGSLISRVLVSSMVNNNDNTYTITTSNTSYLFPNTTFNIGSVTYKVLNNDTYPFMYNNSFTISGTAEPTGIISIELPRLHYFHGTAIDTVGQLSRLNLTTDKFPMVYLLEPIEDSFNNDDNLSLDRSSRVRLFFLSETDEDNWDNDQHYAYSIIPMKNEVINFINHLDEVSRIGKFEDWRAINHAKFGVQVNEKGSVKRIFNDNLSGVELRIDLPIKKETCNGRNSFVPPIIPCNPAVITDSDQTTIVRVPSGGSFSCTPAQQIPANLYNPTKSGKPSMVSGDDGDTQAGRNVDYLTLDFTSPFGTTIRFTNDMGGTVFDGSDGSTSGYVIDNSTRLAYGTAHFFGTLTMAISNAATLVIGPYNDFRVANLGEFDPINNNGDGFKPYTVIFGDLNLLGLNTRWNQTNYLATSASGIPQAVNIANNRRFLNVRNHVY